MQCVIVGGGGFIGRHLGNRLVADGATVLGFDAGLVSTSTETAFPLENFDVLADAPRIPDGTDVVFYLAQSPHYRDFPAQAAHLFGVNTLGPIRWAEAALDAGVSAMLYTSTGTVYAPGFDRMNEDRAVTRSNPYSLSKIAAEEALGLFDDTPLRIVRARLFGAYGPGQRAMLVPAITNRVRGRQAVSIEDNPQNPDDDGGLHISLTYIDDVVDCLVRLVTSDAAAGPINVASDEEVSIRSLAAAIGAALDIEPVFETVDRARPSDYRADVTRLVDLLSPTFTTLRDGIRRTVAASS